MDIQFDASTYSVYYEDISSIGKTFLLCKQCLQLRFDATRSLEKKSKGHSHLQEGPWNALFSK